MHDAASRDNQSKRTVALQATISNAVGEEAERQVTAKSYALQIELVGKVRQMLATAPIIARYGTYTLPMYALDPRSPDFRNLKAGASRSHRGRGAGQACRRIIRGSATAAWFATRINPIVYAEHRRTRVSRDDRISCACRLVGNCWRSRL
jgi:hypothetical protein